MKRTGRLFYVILVFGLVFVMSIPTSLSVTQAKSESNNAGNQTTGDDMNFPLKGIPGEIELDEDPDIAAWQRLQYGMFIHWGLYSDLGGVWNGEPVTKGYSEQIQMWANISDSDYLNVANQFSAESFNPQKVCSLAKDAGMEYVVITSKHHDGFAMFDTDTTDYNIVDSTPFGKDALKQLSDACRDQGLKFGVYFSLVDWNQGHEFDFNNNNPIPASMEPLIKKQLEELMTNYGPIAEVWFDMSSPTADQSKEFTDIVHEYQPNAVINSRIWNNEGDFRTLGDNQIPSVSLDGAWQTPASIYHSTWGYRSWQVRDDFPGKVRDLVEGLVSVRARGGNYLLNIGPRGDGSVVEFEADVLRSIGEWLDMHPDAVLGASATRFGGQPWGEATVNGNNLFLHVMDWPEDGKITLPGLANKVLEVSEDGSSSKLNWDRKGNDLVVELPDKPMDSVLPVIKVKMDGKLKVIPTSTVSTNADSTWTIGEKDMNLGYSYADQGNYYSTKQTTIRQTAYLESKNNDPVYLDLRAKANPDKSYHIQIGNHSEVMTGKQLNDSVIGPFDVPANEVVPLTITLDDPAHNGEELDLQFSSAYLAPVSSATAIKTIVNHYKNSEDLFNEKAAHALSVHLDAVNRFENTQSAEKVTKHLKGFKQLLDDYKEKEMISDKSYDALKVSSNSLIEKWQ